MLASRDGGPTGPGHLYWVDHHYLADYESELIKLQDECAGKDMYIDEPKYQVSKLKERVNDFLLEREIAEKYSTKLEHRFNKLNVTPSGRVLHFSKACPHFAGTKPVRQCHTCLAEGVSESSHGKDDQPNT